MALSVPLEHFRSVRRKFDRIGVDLYAYNLSFQDDFTDEEIQRGFEMADALGVKVMTASANQSVVKRVAPVAERFKMRVGMHNHWQIAPNEFATPTISRGRWRSRRTSPSTSTSAISRRRISTPSRSSRRTTIASSRSTSRM